LFGTCPSNKHCPSTRYSCSANVAMGKDLDIFHLEPFRSLIFMGKIANRIV
jgi:hypothetical protein